MGEGLFRHEGNGAHEVESAGTKPSHVRPEAIAVMKEIGIDISGHRSKSVNEFEAQRFDYVICRAAMHHTPDPRKTFTSLVSRLKPGGQIAITVYRNRQAPATIRRKARYRRPWRRWCDRHTACHWHAGSTSSNPGTCT